MWQKTMNDLLNCPQKNEATIIFELQKLNAEKKILEKARLYDAGKQG